MSFERIDIPLASDVPATTTKLTLFRIGPADASRKVFLQAALHADELPGTMVVHHLLPRLRDADAAGQLRARFVVLPMVNPLGMGNQVLRHHIGRYDIATGGNYNRRWPDLFDALGQAVAARLGPDPDANIRSIRAALQRWIADRTAGSAAQELRLVVLREAHDADLVLDLHCDNDALLHIFTTPESLPVLRPLADWMGAAATLTAADSGGGSFDEVLPLFYRRLAEARPDCPVPMATASATLEYRGQFDTFDALGSGDAARLFGYFCAHGLIAADPGPPPAPAPDPTPLAATEILRAPGPGLLAYRVDLGERVGKGQPIADLVALDGPNAFFGRTPIRAGTDGFVLSRQSGKYAVRGTAIAKIVGTEPLAERGGYLLED